MKQIYFLKKKANGVALGAVKMSLFLGSFRAWRRAELLKVNPVSKLNYFLS